MVMERKKIFFHYPKLSLFVYRLGSVLGERTLLAQKSDCVSMHTFTSH